MPLTKGEYNMKTTKYLTTILSLILVTALLFAGCGKKEETVTAITSEQFTTLYENAKNIYAETPELFIENAEKPNIDLDSVTDSEIPVSEAITLNEVLQTLGEENLSNESFDKELDEAITKSEAIDLILKAYEAIAKRDGYSTDQQDGLNEGSVINRGDSTTVDDAQGTIEKADLVDGTSLTQEELDKLNAEATTDAQKEALDAYETITKEGSWTDAYGVTYTEVVGKPDGSWRRMTDAEAEKTLETASPGEDKYYYAQAELKGKDYVKYDTVTGIVYYDPYEYAEATEAVREESRRKNEAGGDIVSEEEIRQILGDEAAKELFGI